MSPPDASAVLSKALEIEQVLSRYDGKNISLYVGGCGFSLFYNKLYELTKNESFQKKSNRWIQFAIENLSTQEIGSSFCGGAAGVAWYLEFLRQKNIIEFDDDFLKELDVTIYDNALDLLHKGKYDFLHAGGGPILYALRKAGDERALSFLKSAVACLDSTKIGLNAGIAWKDLFNEQSTETYNLGMSHGVPSIVNLLLRVHTKGILSRRVALLIEQSLSWILSCRQHENSLSRYATYSKKNQENNEGPSRLAWCYGDLGIGWIFWQAGCLFNNQEWKNEALDIINKSVTRIDPLENPYLDAGICHGTAGIAHFFNRFYEVTNNQDCRARHFFWIRETLSQAKFSDGFAGYKYFNPYIEGKMAPAYSFLDGICGTGVVLLDYLKKDSDWDECFLLSM